MCCTFSFAAFFAATGNSGCEAKLTASRWKVGFDTSGGILFGQAKVSVSG